MRLNIYQIVSLLSKYTVYYNKVICDELMSWTCDELDLTDLVSVESQTEVLWNDPQAAAEPRRPLCVLDSDERNICGFW